VSVLRVKEYKQVNTEVKRKLTKISSTENERKGKRNEIKGLTKEYEETNFKEQSYKEM
jgi:hypothetical protein